MLLWWRTRREGGGISSSKGYVQFLGSEFEIFDSVGVFLMSCVVEFHGFWIVLSEGKIN